MMNPYSTPTQLSDADTGHDFDPGFEPAGHPHYALVLRMVLWGEPRDEILHRLEVNGVSAGIAGRLYEHAREDRIQTIRGDCTRKLLIGIGLILAAVVVFTVCWFGLRFIPKILLYACFVALGVGSWKFIDGIAGYLMAPTKTGAITDND